MGDNTQIGDLVERTLASSPTMFLSTCADGLPWSAGVFFAEDDPFTLRLIVEASGRTLRNIRANPNVAVVVSTGNPFDAFLQGSADAVIEDDVSLASTKAALLAKSPQAAPLLDGGMPVVALRLDVQSWRATDIANGLIPGVEIETPTPVVPVS